MEAHYAASREATIFQASTNNCRYPIRQASPAMLLAILVLGFLAMVVPERCLAQPSQQSPQVGRPILFVHGFCGDASSWDNLYASLTSLDPNLYPRENGVYVAWYDAKQDQVFFRHSGAVVAETTIPSNARFFAIAFYDPVNGNFFLPL